MLLPQLCFARRPAILDKNGVQNEREGGLLGRE